MTGGALVAVAGRFIGAVTGISWLDLENGKPADGAIFSQPCRAEPVKLEILCMVLWGRTPWEMRAAVMGESRKTRKVGEQQQSSVRRARRRVSPVIGLTYSHARARRPTVRHDP
jgi:hypothetical protein